jgi:hypothetical protein
VTAVAEKPRRGARFEHARFITGSPRAGTATPVLCTVTAVRGTTVYYRTDAGSKFRTDVATFPGVVGRWFDGEGGKR